MSDEARVRALLEQLIDGGTPDEVCRTTPELLPEVRRRWQRMHAMEARVEALFPTPTVAARQPVAVRVRLASGDVPAIPGYDVESVLGRGGMGVVFKARHIRLDRTVALKMLLAGEFAQPDQLARFAREAQVVAGLRHPHIVQVHDVGDFSGRPYFTMEFMEGGSLAQKLAGKPQPAKRAAALLVTLSEAMHAAHSGGVVHRDLKPANVLLTADGTPKVSDFGLARRLHGDGAITLSGATLGTPNYMAPEQAQGKGRTIGPAADIYSLGAILYELLTGRPPFRGETAAETERQVIKDEPVPPTRLNPKVPRDVETICLKCLHKDPARRYATAKSLAADLRRYQRGEPILARRAGVWERGAKWVRRRPAHAAALAGGVLLICVLLGAGLSYSLRRAGVERAVNVELADVTRREHAFDWAGARMAMDRARVRLGDIDEPALVERIHRAEGDLDLVTRLESIRLQRVAVVAGRFFLSENRVRADHDYEETFRAAGLGNVGDEAAVVATRVGNSDIEAALVASLDDWAVCVTPAARRDWLLDVARRADPDPTGWRNRTRDPATWNDREALAALAETAVTESSSLPCLVALAQRLDDAGGDAVPLLQRLLRDHPGDFWANLALGDVLMKTKRPGEAIRYYQAALSIRPDAAAACGNLGRALALDGRGEEAVEQFRRALELDPLFAYAATNLGSALSDLGRQAEALDAFRKGVELDSQSALLRTNYAQALARAGQLDEALVQARKSVELSPDYAVAHNNLGYVLGLMGNVDEALEHVRRSVALDDSDPLAHLNLGQALLGTGHHDEGIAECRRAIELDPGLAEAHSILCADLRTQGRLADAVAEGELAVRAGPKNASCHNNLGAALAASGRLDEAVEHFRKGSRLDPGVAELHSNLGNCLASKGNYVEAIEEFQSAIRLAPNSAQAHGSLGQALMFTGRLSEARDELRLGLELFPDGTPQRAECARQLKVCEGLLALDARIPEILAGRDQPADGKECLRFASLCRLHGQFARAARFCADAFAAEPALAVEAGKRYDAACFAALAGAGQGADAAETSAEDRAHWRGQALQWLNEDLAVLQPLLGSDSVSDRQMARRMLEHWPQDGDLAGIRDEAGVAALPETEREPLRALWRDVAAALADAEAQG